MAKKKKFHALGAPPQWWGQGQGEPPRVKSILDSHRSGSGFLSHLKPSPYRYPCSCFQGSLPWAFPPPTTHVQASTQRPPHTHTHECPGELPPPTHTCEYQASIHPPTHTPVTVRKHLPPHTHTPVSIGASIPTTHTHTHTHS